MATTRTTTGSINHDQHHVKQTPAFHAPIGAHTGCLKAYHRLEVTGCIMQTAITDLGIVGKSMYLTYAAPQRESLLG